jgi:regulatory protein
VEHEARGPLEHTPRDPLEHALGLAYRYLDRRDRTVAEVRGRLQRAGVDEPIVEQALATLAGQGFLDDTRFAKLFVEDKRQLQQWGNERIERSLLAHGIDREVARSALAAGHAETELDRALELLRRRFPAAPENRRDRDRALGVLLRKGYETDLALDALAAHARDGEAA